MFIDPDLIDQLEELIGDRPEFDADRFVFHFLTGVKTEERQGDVVSSTYATGRQIGQSCTTKNILEVSGSIRTGSNGRVTFKLSDFHCSDYTYEQPIILVATPQSEEPVFVTTQQSLSDDSRELEITLLSWDENGERAASTQVDWHCRVPAEVVLI